MYKTEIPRKETLLTELLNIQAQKEREVIEEEMAYVARRIKIVFERKKESVRRNVPIKLSVDLMLAPKPEVKKALEEAGWVQDKGDAGVFYIQES